MAEEHSTSPVSFLGAADGDGDPMPSLCDPGGTHSPVRFLRVTDADPRS